MATRREQLLEMVVERFISHKRPVPSLDLADPLGVSSATIRNDLAALEEMGLLRQPHTSAGRVPTREGWRAYASKYIPPKPLPEASLEHLEMAIGSVDGEQRFKMAMRLASSLSGYAAVMTLAPKEARIETILLSTLEGGRILAVVLLEGGMAREIVLDVGFRPERDVLERLETALREPPLESQAIPAKLQRLEQQASPAVASLAQSLRQRWGEMTAPSVSYSSGASPVLAEPESHDVGFLRGVLDLLERPNSPEHLSPGLFVRVDDPDGISSITVAFKSSLGRASVSILGPTRMRYPKAISVAQAVANVLG